MLCCFISMIIICNKTDKVSTAVIKLNIEDKN